MIKIKSKLIFIGFFVVYVMLSSINTYAYSAQSYCVIDADSRRVLISENEHKRLGMASTTKIMTALVALNNSNTEDIVTISKNASHTEGSSLYLKEGEQIKMIDLIYGLMLNSGNDAAVAIAEHISDDTEKFASLMTKTAIEIGAKETNFINPNGLSDENHYTTAYDLAIITAKAMENDIFSKIVSSKSYTTETLNTKRPLYFTNHNKLLKYIEGCDGVKTGFTKATGRCLVSSLTKNGWRAICVTLNAPDDWNDHKQLFDFVFDKFYLKEIISEHDIIKTIKTDGIGNNGVVEIGAQIENEEKFNQSIESNEKNNQNSSTKTKANENSFSMVVCDDDEIRLDTSRIYDSVNLPIEIGDSVGDVGIFLNNQQVKTINVVSRQRVVKKEEKTFFVAFLKIFSKWVSLVYDN